MWRMCRRLAASVLRKAVEITELRRWPVSAAVHGRMYRGNGSCARLPRRETAAAGGLVTDVSNSWKQGDWSILWGDPQLQVVWAERVSGKCTGSRRI